MTIETLQPAPREIKFGGEGKAEDIKRGFAIATLRNPRPAYDFRPGEIILADCFDDNEKVPVVILTNETKKLKDFSIPQLALDGFFSVKQVIEGMRTYPGYEKINKNSPIQTITFVKQESYNSFSELLKESIRGERFDEIVKLDALRHMFFPTMCFHLANSGGDQGKWVDFLYNFNYAHLISTQKAISMRSLDLLKGRSDLLKEISMDPNHALFRSHVLGIFD